MIGYEGRFCVPNIDDLRSKIIAEAHGSRYSIHPGSTKMYYDLKEIYWWESMKRYISMFLQECPNCQQFKAKQLKPGVLT